MRELALTRFTCSLHSHVYVRTFSLLGENSHVYVLIAYWEKRERGVVVSRPLRALRAA